MLYASLHFLSAVVFVTSCHYYLLAGIIARHCVVQWDIERASSSEAMAIWAMYLLEKDPLLQ